MILKGWTINILQTDFQFVNLEEGLLYKKESCLKITHYFVMQITTLMFI